MRWRVKARNVPGRVAIGAYIAHAGWAKWHGSGEQANGVHTVASGAFPALEPIPQAVFLKALAGGEVATAALLLNPLTSNRAAGLALTGFAGSLLAMYWRTATMHQPGSVWPTPAGMAVSTDVWMLGIGLGLLADPGRGVTSRPRRR